MSTDSNAPEWAKADLATVDARMLNTWALLDEAANDPALSDAAFRLLVRGRWAAITPEDEQWANDVIAALPRP